MSGAVPRSLAAALVLVLALTSACSRAEPPKTYPLEGQVLAVFADRGELSVKHGDIPNFMPAMTMTYAVEPKTLLEGRTPGELIKATLTMAPAGPRLTAITHTGSAPLPDSSNEVAMAAGVLDVGDAVPDAALIDQNDKRRAFAEWTGTPTLLTFIYTRCPLPTFCPLMDQNFATIQRVLAEDPQLHGRVKLVSVTFDPEHDTPAELADHAAKMKADTSVWTFLTGDRATTDKFAARFGVGVMRDPGNPAQITHNLRTILIGADGRIVKIYGGSDWTPGAVVSDLRALVRRP